MSMNLVKLPIKWQIFQALVMSRHAWQEESSQLAWISGVEKFTFPSDLSNYAHHLNRLIF